MQKFMKLIQQNKMIAIALALVMVVCIVSALGSVLVSAETVKVEEYTDPDLTFVKIDGRDPSFGADYTSSGTFEKTAEGYTMQSNAVAPWYGQDHVDFAYKEIKFNFSTDSEAVMTLECTVADWTGLSKTAGAGIMIRSSLSPDASMAFVHARPEAMLTVYRMKDKLQASAASYGPIPSYPVSVKLVLAEGKVSTYYKFANSSDYVLLSKGINFVYTDTVYVGLAAHTSDRMDLATAKFEDFTVAVEANADWSYADPTEGEGGPVVGPTEAPVVLPEDIQPASNVLMRETFTDNSMFNGTESITNPIWTTSAESTNVITNKDATNRYLGISYLDSGHYYAGDTDWTDYSYEMELTFAEDTILREENRFSLLTRLKYNVAHGISAYTVTFNNDDGKNLRTVTLGYMNMCQKLPDAGYQIALETKEFDYLADLGKPNTVRIDAFDNRITVYWNGEVLFDFVDDLSVESSNQNRIDILCTGNVGFVAYDTAVEIDNIVVKKLHDPMGGDYDNRIGGRFDEPIPDYLDKYESNDWAY